MWPWVPMESPGERAGGAVGGGGLWDEGQPHVTGGETTEKDRHAFESALLVN